MVAKDWVSIKIMRSSPILMGLSWPCQTGDMY